MKGVPGAFGGMDTHVKEGQLYVQHQKFGKVSPRNVAVFFFFRLGVCGVDRKSVKFVQICNKNQLV